MFNISLTTDQLNELNDSLAIEDYEYENQFIDDPAYK